MTVKIVKKPWGREEWIELNDKYCFKKLYINAGTKTSLQFHELKKETNYLMEGEAIFYSSPEGEHAYVAGIGLEWPKPLTINAQAMTIGEGFTVEPFTIHRIEAVTDIVIMEVSTPEVDDVIRIQDDSDRPDGKIDSEHE